MNEKTSMEGGETVTSLITSLPVSAEPWTAAHSPVRSTSQLPTLRTVPLFWPLEGLSLVVLPTGGRVPLSSQAPLAPIYPSSQWRSGAVEFVAAPRGVAQGEPPAQLLPGLHHWNVLQYPSHSFQVGHIFKLSFTTTELQTSYIHLLGLFFCCFANCYVFFRTMKLRSG